MSATEELMELSLRRQRSWIPGALARLLTSVRFYVYLACTAAALITSWHMGKEALWDTLDYHFYAGFSAIHDRFGMDYFPAAFQAYLNPYAYAPFYLLATSGMTALQVALILAALQSGVLWLTYEIAILVVPTDQPRARLAVGVCAVVLAFANPVLVNQFGSSFCDITTAEVVLAGWLALLTAVRSPSARRVVCAAVLLGAAAALKLTNVLDAVAAAPMVLFIPGEWRTKLRYGALYALALGVAFAAVSAPWSIRLEEHFGNPMFPIFNGLFRSPYFTTSRLVDYRFVPTSVGAALGLPFAMILPRAMVHVEWAAPDLRYAFLLVLAALSLTVWIWRSVRGGRVGAAPAEQSLSGRAFAALGCGFLTAWILWVAESGNSRYFIPMACIAAVLGMVLAFRLFAAYPKAKYVPVVLLALQFFQLHFGTQYHDRLPWRDAPWFDVSVPSSIASQPALYLSVGVQSDSFIVPYLARGSGFINLHGVYTLGADGPNGQRIEALVRKYSPHLRILVRDPAFGPAHTSGLPFLGSTDDALQPFGLRIDPQSCSKIIVPDLPPTEGREGALNTCEVVPYHGGDAAVLAGERAANRALDHLEEACPELFQPRGMTTYILRGKKSQYGYSYVRSYPNTDVVAWVSRKWVRFQRTIGGGHEQYAGPESVWEKEPLRVACRRTGGGDEFLKVLQPLK